jgi:hypothetical protein
MIGMVAIAALAISINGLSRLKKGGPKNAKRLIYE